MNQKKITDKGNRPAKMFVSWNNQLDQETSTVTMSKQIEDKMEDILGKQSITQKTKTKNKTGCSKLKKKTSKK